MIYIYGTDDCNNCKWAVRDSKKHKEEYTYKNVTYKKFYNEMIERGGDPRKIPQIWWDAEYVGDYNDLTKKLFEKLY